MVFLAGSLAAVAAAPARADDAAPIYQPDAISAIELQMPQSSMEALETEPPSDEYQPGTFSLALGDGTPEGVGGFSAPIEVGIRLKGGQGSFRPLADGKAGFKIKFNFVKGQKFLGLKKLTLNNMVQDPSMLHETLAYEVFRSVGLPAPRTGYAYVRLNGEDYGVYLNLETYDDVSLPHWFASTRHLYEADAPATDVTPGSAPEFEVDEGDDGDLSDLEALIAAANSGAGDWSDGMEAVADLGQMSLMWAVERYVGHWDGYAGTDGAFRPNNYYLHSLDTGPEAGRFEMMPWGTDQTWGSRIEFDEPAGGLLFNECFADSDCQALYGAALGALPAPVAALELGRQARCLAERLAPWQALEDEERREYDAAQIAEGVEETRDFIAERPGELAEWLGLPAPGAAPERPCALPPDEETGLGAGGAAAPPTAEMIIDRRPRIRLGRIAVEGRTLKARVKLPLRGKLRLDAWAGPSVSGPRACSGESAARAAGWAKVHCQLHEGVLRRLDSEPVRLTVRAAFRVGPESGTVVVRHVRLPRR